MRKGSRPDLRPVTAKSVDELEGFAPPAGGAPEPVRRARRVPVGELSAGDALLLLRRGHAPRYVLPRALELLEADPWLWADDHDGDLLVEALDTDPAQWPPGPEWRARLVALARAALAAAEARYDFERRPDAERRVRDAAQRLGPDAAAG